MSQENQWWRDAVIYQVYPRSFADSDGDGFGDLPGITSHLEDLAYLGVDAVWLSPFYPSPGNDAGYDVADYIGVDTTFGTLDDFDALVNTAHDLGLRIIIDLVPNHTSSAHPWFKEALKSAPGSPERDRYIFRDGKGSGGNEPPNNWQSVFGGPAWTRTIEADGTPGQWYLHLFDTSQPDLNWDNPWVNEQFDSILRFWLDRGVDGFRVDVAHGLDKVEGLPDWYTDTDAAGGVTEEDECPFFGQPGSHRVYRQWRKILDEYPGDRVLCAEAWVEPLDKLALWVRPDEMDQAFNFTFLMGNWDAPTMKAIISDSLQAFSRVGAPATWVLSNHDTIRHATRLALDPIPPHGVGVAEGSTELGSPEEGLRRARSATTMMLALPGSAYLYQGEELGLPEVLDIPGDARQDPTWIRTSGERYGRDGCRVPIPWNHALPASGFNATGASWLPQPADWHTFARDLQIGDSASTLELYRSALTLRRELGLGRETLHWIDGYPRNILAFRVGGITVLCNYGDQPVELPRGTVILSSSPLVTGDKAVYLPTSTTAWIEAPQNP